MIKRESCLGCRNDFYNGKNGYGVEKCWSRGTGKMVRRIKIGNHICPPYNANAAKMYPSCYHSDGYAMIPPESLTKDGYWR